MGASPGLRCWSTRSGFGDQTKRYDPGDLETPSTTSRWTRGSTGTRTGRRYRGRGPTRSQWESRGNYIVSLANWDQVISISPDGQSIEWQLGGPDTDYHFLDPADRFYGQHTASELSNGKHSGIRQRERPPRRGGRVLLQGA